MVVETVVLLLVRRGLLTQAAAVVALGTWVQVALVALVWFLFLTPALVNVQQAEQ